MPRPKGLKYKIVKINKGWFKKGYPKPKNAYSYQKGHPSYSTKESAEKIKKANLGKHMSIATEFKKEHKSERKGKKFPQQSNENHPNWKGDKASYGALHSWVNRHLGKAKQCKFCKRIGEGRQIHWANKSGLYKRDLSDWISLCVKCHSKYDKQKQNTKTK